MSVTSVGTGVTAVVEKETTVTSVRNAKEHEGTHAVYLSYREITLLLTLCDYRTDTGELRAHLQNAKDRWDDTPESLGSYMLGRD